MKIFLIAAGLAASVAATAQTTEGKIVYEKKINVHKMMPPEAEQFKAMVPEFSTSKMELSFKGSQSLYKAPKTDEDELPSTEPGGGGGGGGGFGMMMRRMGGGDGESFKDYETGLATDIKELGPKKYLLEDTLQRISWKLTSDTMTLMGHLCHKATAVQKDGLAGMMGQRMPGGGGGNRQNGGPAMAGAADSNRTRTGGDSTRGGFRMNDSARTRMMATLTKPRQIVAWYADDIASPAGPEGFYGLPGVIMKLDIDEGSIVYTPLQISATADAVKAPTSGKKITREEYGKMMMEQAQMMQRMGGGMRRQM